MTMKRMLGKINRRIENPASNGTAASRLVLNSDSPEAVVVKEVTAFCESGAPGAPNAGTEYLHLPAIVDAAESSPAAAKEAATTIRRFLSKEYYNKGYAQYNAIMLSRILTENPGRVFTQNFDAQFVTTVKRLLREGNDLSVQQILRETLDYFEVQKAASNDTLHPLVQMWIKEKSKTVALFRPPMGYAQPQVYPVPPVPQRHVVNQQQPGPLRSLPPPEELAARIEEAKTTARLLVQTLQSTPQSELLANDLVSEFAERARLAHNSVQEYMNYDNPAPDADTMITLIETNEQLHVALSKYQRSVVQARSGTSAVAPGTQPDTVSTAAPVAARDEQFLPPSGPPQSHRPTREDGDAYQAPSQQAPSATTPTTSQANDSASENPFADDVYRDDGPAQSQNRYSLFVRTTPHIHAADSHPSETPTVSSANATTGDVHELDGTATDTTTHQERPAITKES